MPCYLIGWHYTIRDHIGDDHAGDQDDDEGGHNHHSSSATSWSLKSNKPCYLISIIHSTIILVMIIHDHVGDYDHDDHAGDQDDDDYNDHDHHSSSMTSWSLKSMPCYLISITNTLMMMMIVLVIG